MAIYVLTAYQLAYVIDQAAYFNLFDLKATRAAMARGNGRPPSVLARAIELHLSGSAGTRSKGEDDFLTHFTHDEPIVNTHLLNEEVDFHWPDRRLIVEIYALNHDRTPTQRDDARRDAKLQAAGCTPCCASARSRSTTAARSARLQPFLDRPRGRPSAAPRAAHPGPATARSWASASPVMRSTLRVRSLAEW